MGAGWEVLWACPRAPQSGRQAKLGQKEMGQQGRATLCPTTQFCPEESPSSAKTKWMPYDFLRKITLKTLLLHCATIFSLNLEKQAAERTKLALSHWEVYS